MATVTVTLPPSLLFLVSNFHSFVNIKLDSTNYLLWRIQVENVMQANGFYEYLEGSVACPSPQIRSDDGNLIPNPAFTLWKLIDTHLLSCLIASLSPTTLPYILGLHHSHEVWESLSNRYNTLSKSNVQEYKGKLYTITKTSTMEHYIDTIKEYAQKLAAAGSPVEDDDLIFHTLRGLPSIFNGFKTMIRALQQQGHGISFNAVVTMLHGEDAQLLQESPTVNDTGTVLVATQHHGKMPASSMPPSLPTQPLSVTSSSSYNDLTQTFGQLGISPQYASIQSVGLPQQPSIANAFGPTQTLHTQFSGSTGQPVMTPPHMPHSSMPPQFFQQTFRGFARGRGRGPRLPCDICGRSNHTTNYCYYRPPSPSFFPKSPWGPHIQTSPQNSPWMTHSAPWMNPYPYTYPTGLPMYQPPIPQSPSMVSSQTTGPNVTTPQPSFAVFCPLHGPVFWSFLHGSVIWILPRQ